MTILDFLRQGGKVRGAVYFNHGTPDADLFEEHVRSYCTKWHLDFVYTKLSAEKDAASWESFWSQERNQFFQCLGSPVITAHNLDDAVEWWVFTSLRGNPSLTPSRNRNILRPFLTTRKSELKKWANNKDVPFIEDSSNKDIKFTRNFIRHRMISDCLHVNPGIHKTIKKKLIERESNAFENWG